MNYSEMWFARIPHKLANNLECMRDMRSCHCVVVKMLTSIRCIVGLCNEQLSICVNFNTKLKKSVPSFGISERADESGSSADLLHTSINKCECYHWNMRTHAQESRSTALDLVKRKEKWNSFRSQALIPCQAWDRRRRTKEEDGSNGFVTLHGRSFSLYNINVAI